MNRKFILLSSFSLTFIPSVISCSEKGLSDSSEAPTNVEKGTLVVVDHTSKDLVSAETPISFNQHIQPILSSNCYHCHGPDSGTRLPEDEPYRLDKEKEALAIRGNGKANIIKGDPDNSYLVQLMESKDPEMVMPLHPTRSPHGKIMDPADIALVRRWVKEGAVFEDHWAYIAPEKAEFPDVQQSDWVRKPIDHFILAKLEEKGLKPNSDEAKTRLLRRLTFDLTGLPPTAEEILSFTSDKRDFEKVYEEKVEALLNTDAYAEHFGRHWLDVARYGDTHGIHNDNYRSIWPYRDWVINAFRSNMKFDEFTKVQIAGDMMPDSTVEQKVATGFHRCMPTTGEGGSIVEEVNASYAQERVNTTFATWLGVTAGCAACHDHKFDAITTKENYEFSAFFRNTTMKAMDGNNANHAPIIKIPVNPEKIKEIEAAIAVNNAKKAGLEKSEQPQFDAWFAKERAKSAKLTNPSLPDFNSEGLLVSLPLNNQSKGTGHAAFSTSGRLRWTAGATGKAVHFTRGSYINLGQVVDFDTQQAFSVGAWINSPAKATGGVISKLHSKEANRGFDLYAADGKIAVHMSHKWPENAIKVTTVAALPDNKWNHVMFTYDGSSKASGIKIYFNGKFQPQLAEKDTLKGTIKTSAPFLLGSRHQGGHFKDGKLQNLKIYNRALSPKEMVTAATAGSAADATFIDLKNPTIIKQMREHYFAKLEPKSNEINKAIAKLAAGKTGPSTLIMQEKADTKPIAHVLIRGDYTQPGAEVSPGVPAAFPPMTKDMPKNRLGLAKWLVASNNPLPARVTVNRYWYYIFGSGIVETNSDFGVMGARPTHPELLDWLAVDFVESGWDFHHLLKQMVMSSTYRQRATISKEKLAKDPLNIYYARAPRYRLDAEQIRDLALKSSGLLHPKIGGPSVKPYMPQGVWEAVAMKGSNTRHYKQDKGDSLYRRSLYTFIKRTAVHPTMELLNAPTREEACVKRDLTNTPLQAFVIMNDPQFVESSRQLATLALQNATTLEDRINYISVRLISRKMDDREIEMVKATLAKIQARFKAKPAEAKEFISVGQSTAPAELDPTELASWSIIANQLLNLDETLNK
ncbi:MAG: hypothetical protein ACI9E1_000337 [Cryomorphaceae bacterium]|jgi:hypothetical protein